MYLVTLKENESVQFACFNDKFLKCISNHGQCVINVFTVSHGCLVEVLCGVKSLYHVWMECKHITIQRMTS